MKTISTKNRSVTKSFVLGSLLLGSSLVFQSSFAQTYYSRFDDPAGKYQVTNPTGCAAPAIQNASGMAAKGDNDYAYFSAATTTAYNCETPYLFDVNLNLPSGTTSIQGGNQAGWKIRVSPGINADSLGKYITISTYLNGKLQESKTGNGLIGNDLGQNGTNWFIYFESAKAFDMIELAVSPKIIPVNKNFQFNVYYAFGSSNIILPAQIDDFKAVVSGKNVLLSWNSLTETNVSHYRLERSNDGVTYSAVANISAKGNSNVTTSYTYTDKVTADGNYLYRLVTVNADGSFKTTNAVSAVTSGQGKLLLYPSVVTAGQKVNVTTSVTGLLSVRLFDAQGRLVSHQRISSGGQFTISTTGLRAGVYNVKIISATGNLLQSKIVVN